MEYMTHITKNGDRWDLLAWEYYRQAFATEMLLEANPAYADKTILPSGLELVVPIVDAEALKPKKDEGLPWR